jgi:hypothetical protein
MRSTRGHGITARGDFRGERVAMATFTVTTTADVVNATDGKLSLREAVAQANAAATADMIVFGSAIEGKTLVLTGGELAVTADLTVDGDQDNDGSGVIISGGGVSRIARISGIETDATLQDLVVQNGHSQIIAGSATVGGAIFAEGRTLSVHNSVFSNNTTFARLSDEEFDFTSADGGAIFCWPWYTRDRYV